MAEGNRCKAKLVYIEFLGEVKRKILSSRISVYRKLNKGLIGLYWEIGKAIVERRPVVRKLSEDLTNQGL